jgi:hypothetical protein
MLWPNLEDPDRTDTFLLMISPSREDRLPLLVERANPLAVILALVNSLPVGQCVRVALVHGGGRFFVHGEATKLRNRSTACLPKPVSARSYQQ